MAGRGRPNGSERGRSAEKPRHISFSGWKDILIRVKDEQKKDFLPVISAGVAFYALLAIFPGIAAAISIYGLVADPVELQRQLSELSALLPAEAWKILDQQLTRVVSTSGGTLSLGVVGGVLLALWSASKGVKALMGALNLVYEEEETRGFFKLTAVAMGLTLGAILLVLIALGAILVLPMVSSFLNLPDTLQSLIEWGRWLILAVVAIVGLAVLYRYAPDRSQASWSWVSWGSVVATVLWLLTSVLFSFYVANFASYNKTYGSVGAMMILLMWFLLIAYAILIGAELNAEMEHQTRRDTTTGERQPMGERGARMADTLGKTQVKKKS